jgi:type IV pilus assembly protein PilW
MMIRQISRAGQRGYSLIEVMVALLVALFLLVGLGTLVSGTRRTSTNQTSLAQLQDEERLAMSVLNDVLQTAGYYDSNPNDTTFLATAQLALPAVSISGGPTLAAGQIIGGTHTSNAVPDTLTVQYRTNGSDQVISCAGQTSTAAKVFINYFSVPTSGINANQLQCTPDGTAANTVTLVNGVVNFQVWYGVSTSTSNSADTYETADQVTNWGNVISARITLTLNNPLYTQPGQPQYVTFTRVIALQSQAGPSQAST